MHELSGISLPCFRLEDSDRMGLMPTVGAVLAGMRSVTFIDRRVSMFVEWYQRLNGGEG